MTEVQPATKVRDDALDDLRARRLVRLGEHGQGFHDRDHLPRPAALPLRRFAGIGYVR
jgi:hypothetical protein